MRMGHQEIFEQMRREILAGKFDGENALPSETTLARRFGVSRPTISRVTLDLRREGLIMTHKGVAAQLNLTTCRQPTATSPGSGTSRQPRATNHVQRTRLAIVFHGTELALCEEI